jgi:hypothetical protein
VEPLNVDIPFEQQMDLLHQKPERMLYQLICFPTIFMSLPPQYHLDLFFCVACEQMMSATIHARSQN